MRSVEIYVSGQNLFTVSNYPGFEPGIEQRDQCRTAGCGNGGRSQCQDLYAGMPDRVLIEKQIDINN